MLTKRSPVLAEQAVDKTRKGVVRFIAQRYGLGYSEINNFEIYLSSAYLPDKPNVYDAKMPELPDISLPHHNPFVDYIYTKQLGAEEEYSSSSPAEPTYLSISSPEKKLSQAEIDEIIVQLDEKFTPIESKSDVPPETKQNSFIFCRHQIGIKKPIVTNGVLWGSRLGQKGLEDSQYSAILSFSTSDNLHQFLNGIPEISKASAPEGIYATYECSYGSGCYQILIPYGQEYKALLLLFGENIYTSELPVTQFILNSLQPKPFLSSLFSHSSSDAEYSAALDIMQRCIIKKENTSLSDFDENTGKLIQSSKRLKQSLLSTTDFFKKNVEVGKLVDNIFPSAITDIIMNYHSTPAKRR